MKKISLVLAVLTVALSILMYGCKGSDGGKVSDRAETLAMTTTQNITTDYSTDLFTTSAAPEGLLGTDASSSTQGQSSTAGQSSTIG